MDNNYSKNYNIGNNNNSNKTTIILGAVIVVLLIVAIVLGTLYFTNNKNSGNNNNNSNQTNNGNNQNNTNNNNNTPTIPNESTEKTLTDEELKKYLTYVPMLLEYDIEKEGSLGGAYGFNLDAYTGKNVTVSEMDKRLLLAMAYNMTEKANVKVAGNYRWCGGTSCTGDEYVSVEKLNSSLKKMYNMDNAGDTVGSYFRIVGGSVEKSNQYYVRYNGMGGTSMTKGLSKVKNYDVKGDTLTIYEQVGFIGNKLATGKALKYTTEADDQKYDFDSNTSQETIDKYFEDNADKFAIFKHTFKLGSNNEYYYYSTEESK